jgi:predicted CxxxxCH...CXXCH cytochrome family protein
VLAGTAPTDPTVGAHQKHVAATAMHAAWDCTTCHTKPSSALTPGHLDGTGSVVQAEVTFSSLNPASVFNFTALTCASNYCHGSGRATATAPAWTSTTALACVNGCHGGAPSYTGMSSRHSKSDHKKACNYCHGSVVNTTPAITNVALHVDGVKQVVFPGGGTYNASTKKCSSVPGCHNGASDPW